MARLLHLLTGIAVVLMCTDAVLADVRTTPHALVKSTRPDASDICVFCHTPNVKGTAPQKAPRWQSSIGTNVEFTIYDDIGRIGLGKSSVGSQSMACLSCHDANQARTMIGKADHPFGVPYRGATKYMNLSPSRPAIKEPNEHFPTREANNLMYSDEFHDPSQGTVEDRTVWWVSKTGTTARRTRNDLPLYNRVLFGGDTNIPFIECSSCHDPHSNNAMFLRIPNTGSQLCLTCHIK